MHCRNKVFALCLFACVVFLFSSCSTKKKTWFHRQYHNTTAKYNGYFNGNESIKYGIKKITDDFDSNEFEEFALEFANTINFDEGFKHSDYKSGDKIAAFTIGGLVAGSLRVKTLAKAGVLAKILPFLIKFWWVILAPIVGLIGIWSKNKKDNNQTKTRRRRRKD